MDWLYSRNTSTVPKLRNAFSACNTMYFLVAEPNYDIPKFSIVPGFCTISYGIPLHKRFYGTKLELIILVNLGNFCFHDSFSQHFGFLNPWTGMSDC